MTCAEFECPYDTRQKRMPWKIVCGIVCSSTVCCQRLTTTLVSISTTPSPTTTPVLTCAQFQCPKKMIQHHTSERTVCGIMCLKMCCLWTTSFVPSTPCNAFMSSAQSDHRPNKGDVVVRRPRTPNKIDGGWIVLVVGSLTCCTLLTVAAGLVKLRDLDAKPLLAPQSQRDVRISLPQE
jgi:hypothetical protein